MVYPIGLYYNDTAIKDMEKIEATLEICTLYKGVPHGIAIIQYTDPNNKWCSFRGAGVFNNGKLHNTPFSCVNGEGFRFSYSMMQNGRPADGSLRTEFYKDGE
jgi:hypothetical protein